MPFTQIQKQQQYQHQYLLQYVRNDHYQYQQRYRHQQRYQLQFQPDHVNPQISHSLFTNIGSYSELMKQEVLKKELSTEQIKLNKWIIKGNKAIIERELPNPKLKCKDWTPMETVKHYESSSTEKWWNINISRAKSYQEAKFRLKLKRKNNNKNYTLSTHRYLSAASTTAAALLFSNNANINNNNNNASSTETTPTLQRMVYPIQ
jgi:hypothetical protein